MTNCIFKDFQDFFSPINWIPYWQKIQGSYFFLWMCLAHAYTCSYKL